MGGFDGSTFGTSGNQDTSIICGVPDGQLACPAGYGPVVDKQGVTLYPVDSEFGYYVVDFLGAQGKSETTITRKVLLVTLLIVMAQESR